MKRVQNFNKKWINPVLIDHNFNDENFNENYKLTQAELYVADKFTNTALLNKKSIFNINKFVYDAVEDWDTNVDNVNFTKNNINKNYNYYFLNLYYLNCKYLPLFNKYYLNSIFNLLKLNILSNNNTIYNNNLNINWLLNNKILVYRFKALQAVANASENKHDVILTSVLTNNFTLNLNIYNYIIISNKFRLYFKSKSLTQSTLNLTKNNWFTDIIYQDKQLLKLFNELYDNIEIMKHLNNDKFVYSKSLMKRYFKILRTICKIFFKKKNFLTKKVVAKLGEARFKKIENKYLKKYLKFENKIIKFLINNKRHYKLIGSHLKKVWSNKKKINNKNYNNFRYFKYFALNKKIFYKMKKRFKLYKIFIKRLQKLTLFKYYKNTTKSANIFKKLYKYTNVFLNETKPYIFKKEGKIKPSNVFLSNKNIQFTFNLIKNLPKKNNKIWNKFFIYLKHYKTSTNLTLAKHKYNKFNKLHTFFKKKGLTFENKQFLKKLNNNNNYFKKINPILKKYNSRKQLRKTLSFRRFRKYFTYLKKKLKWRKRWNVREEANWYTYFDKKRWKRVFRHKAPFKPHLHEAKFNINKKYLIFNINKNKLITYNQNKFNINASNSKIDVKKIKLIEEVNNSSNYNLINKINYINLMFNNDNINEDFDICATNRYFFKNYNFTNTNNLNCKYKRFNLLKFKNTSNQTNKVRLLNKILYQNDTKPRQPLKWQKEPESISLENTDINLKQNFNQIYLFKHLNTIQTLDTDYQKLKINNNKIIFNNNLFFKKIYVFYKNILKRKYIKNYKFLFYKNFVLKRYIDILNSYSTKFNNIYLNELEYLNRNYLISEKIQNNLYNLDIYNLYKHILYKKVINRKKQNMKLNTSIDLFFYNFEIKNINNDNILECSDLIDKYTTTDDSSDDIIRTYGKLNSNLLRYNCNKTTKYLQKWFNTDKSFFYKKFNPKFKIIKVKYKQYNYNFFLNLTKFKQYKIQKIVIKKLSLNNYNKKSSICLNKLLTNIEKFQFKSIKFKKSLLNCSFIIWKKNLKFVKCKETRLFYNIIHYTKYFKFKRRRYKKLLRRHTIFIIFKRIKLLKTKWTGSSRKNYKFFTKKCFKLFKPSIKLNNNSNFLVYLLLTDSLKTNNIRFINNCKQVLNKVKTDISVKNEFKNFNINCILESKIFLNYMYTKINKFDINFKINNNFDEFKKYISYTKTKVSYNFNSFHNLNNRYINKFNKISYKSKLEKKFYIFFKKYFLLKKNNNKMFKFIIKHKTVPYYKYNRRLKVNKIIFKQPRRILNNTTQMQYKILLNSGKYKNKYFAVHARSIYIRNNKNWLYRKALNNFIEVCDYRLPDINDYNTKFHNFFVDFNRNRLTRRNDYLNEINKSKNYSFWWFKLLKVNKFNIHKYKKKYKALQFYKFSSNNKYYYNVLYSLFKLVNSTTLIKNVWLYLLKRQKKWAGRYRHYYFHRYINFKFYNYNKPVNARFFNKFIPLYDKEYLRSVYIGQRYKHIKYINLSKFSNYRIEETKLKLSINRSIKNLKKVSIPERNQVFNRYIFKNFYKKRSLRRRFMIKKVAFFFNEKSSKINLTDVKKYNYIQYRNLQQIFKNSIYFTNIWKFIKFKYNHYTTFTIKKLILILFKKFYMYSKLYKLNTTNVNLIFINNFKNFINKYDNTLMLNLVNKKNFKKYKINYIKTIYTWKTNLIHINKYFNKINKKFVYKNFKLSKYNLNLSDVESLNKIDLNYNLINLNSYITKLQRFRLITTYSYKLFLNTLFIYPSILMLTPYLNKNYNKYLLTISKSNKKFIKVLKSSFDDRNLNFNFYFFNHLITSFVETKTSLSVSLNIHFNNYNIIPLEYRIILNIWTQRVLRFHYIFKWAVRLKIIMKLLYLVVAEKDLHLLMKIITKITPKIQYRSHRRFFKFIIFIFRAFFVFLFLNFNVKGMQFEFAGKISVTGNARTRKMYYKLGKPSRSTYTYSTKYIYKTVSTYMGVLGIKVWIFY